MQHAGISSRRLAIRGTCMSLRRRLQPKWPSNDDYFDTERVMIFSLFFRRRQFSPICQRLRRRAATGQFSTSHTADCHEIAQPHSFSRSHAR